MGTNLCETGRMFLIKITETPRIKDMPIWLKSMKEQHICLTKNQ